MAEKIIMFCRYYVLLIVLLPYRTLQFFYHKLSFPVSRASNLDAAEAEGIENHVPIQPKLSSSFITDSEIQSEFAHHAPGVARMNNGSFGCCPASVISALQQWQLKLLCQPDHFYFNELEDRILESRYKIKDLINAEDVDEVSIVDNISTAVAVVLQQAAWAFAEGKFNKGDAVIMFHCAYGAVKNSIKAYFSRAGGYVIEVQFNFPLISNEEIISEFSKALEREKGNGRRVRLAVIDHVTCMPSVIMPVKQLVKICREEGVEQVFIDAAHGVGCVDVDMQEIGADFYASTLYKWFFCPPAAAFLYCRKSAAYSDLQLHHPVVSHRYGMGLAEESFWVGTRDYTPYLVLPSAMEFVKRFEGGVEGIRKMNHDAVVEMGKMLAEAWGTNLGCPPDMCASMIMVGLPSCLGISSDDDAMKLWAHLRKKFGVEVRIHYQAPKEGEVVLTTGYVRICHQIYNKVDDYYKLRDTINQLVHDGFTCALEIMEGKKIIAICQSGGEFLTEKDGTLSYRGGDAHAIDIDDQMTFNEFKTEVTEMFSCSNDNMSIKYFLPGNKKTLITVSNDKDLKRMIKFHSDFATVDIYVIEEIVAPDVSNMPASRSSRTTLSETVVPVDASLDVVDFVGDTTQPDIPLDASLDIVDDASPIDAHIDIPNEISPIFPLLGHNDEKHAKGAQQWQNAITGVGQRFSSVHEFRESLRKYAIAHQFAFRYKKNDSHRVTVKCKAEGCPWRIHASRLSTTQLICIKKMNPTHTCEGAVATTGHQATRSWVASIIKEKLKFLPNYKPKDIVNDIKQEYGIQLNYFQAWRGKEIAKEQLQGSYKEAYNQLPFFCDKIMETNPGSLATFTTKEDSSFHRLFVSFHASLYGFQQGCRPLLFLDSIPLKSKYQGTLLAATAADGNDGVFPVAFTVVDAETDDNWHWFLLQLKSAFSITCPITFVADRQKGLKESIADIFKDSYHGYCLRYLTEQLIRDLKGQFSHEVKRLMVEDLYAAAYAPRPENFQSCLESIKSISLEAYNWIVQSEPQNWANAFFQGARYNHMASNFGELFYSWASDAHELPITQMVDVIRGKIMELIYTRRAESNQWLTRLTPSMEEKLDKETQKVRNLQVLLLVGNTFEVRGDSTEVVDVDRWDCSCRGWQITGLPCCHAIAVIGCMGRSPYDYCSRYFTTESYRLTYSESIHPVPNVDMPVVKASSQLAVTVTPPPTRRPPGRPTTKKYGPQEMSKRQLQCSRCKGLGHNKSTCKELL